ncbi:MAG: thioredoxin domain-containing protein [Isosphaeraceae bacterium]
MNLATLLLALALPCWTEPASEPVMLDFSAEWCGPCRQMRPAVDQLLRKGYPIKPVDVDENPELAERYQVTGVPTFVVIDPDSGRELARTSGAQPVAQLASLYQQARAKHVSATRPTEPNEAARVAEDARDAAPAPNPKPWETVVRIKVHGQGAIGFGSGTVIYSSPTESIILTCAHIFKLEGRAQVPPSRFPQKITVDLFDGKLSGYKPAQVHYANETHPGQAIDYDFTRDVGLIRIRPGRRLPYARVVPAHWQPKARMNMTTVGCSEGNDATAWSTVILNPSMKGLQGNGAYEAIECAIAPKQGRSGGGLFTDDGYVAGVCDFAEPRGDRGLYATPNSIYSILNRNNLMALYAPARTVPGSSNTLMANNADRVDPRRGAQDVDVARGQSPDGAPVAITMGRPEDAPGSVTLPPPEMLGIRPPVLASRRNDSANETRTRRSSWLPKSDGEPVTAGLRMDPSLDTDRFREVDEMTVAEGAAIETTPKTERNTPSEEEEIRAATPERVTSRRKPSGSGWRPGRSPLPSLTVGAN